MRCRRAHHIRGQHQQRLPDPVPRIDPPTAPRTPKLRIVRPRHLRRACPQRVRHLQPPRRVRRPQFTRLNHCRQQCHRHHQQRHRTRTHTTKHPHLLRCTRRRHHLLRVSRRLAQARKIAQRIPSTRCAQSSRKPFRRSLSAARRRHADILARRHLLTHPRRLNQLQRCHTQDVMPMRCRMKIIPEQIGIRINRHALRAVCHIQQSIIRRVSDDLLQQRDTYRTCTDRHPLCRSSATAAARRLHPASCYTAPTPSLNAAVVRRRRIETRHRSQVRQIRHQELRRSRLDQPLNISNLRDGPIHNHLWRIRPTYRLESGCSPHPTPQTTCGCRSCGFVAR